MFHGWWLIEVRKLPNIPFPGFGDSKEEIKGQSFELIRKVYEEKVGGADLGDVFSIVGNTLTLALDVDNPGLEKSDGQLSIQHKSDGGTKGTSGGLSLKLVDNSLTLTDAGLKVTTPGSIITGTVEIIWPARSVTVNDANVQSNSRIFITVRWPGGSASFPPTQITLYISNIIVGTSFEIWSMTFFVTTYQVHWMIVNL